MRNFWRKINLVHLGIIFPTKALASYGPDISSYLFVIGQDFADEAESAMLRENNNLTEEQCSGLMKTLRMVWLEPVLKDLHDADNNEFLVLEERLRSVYHKLDSDFRQQAPGNKSLCSNLAYIYELVRRFFFY